MFAPSQFRVLYRRFLTQILDRDVLAPGGDVSDAVARFAALLASVSFLMAVLIVPRYFTTNLTPAGLMYSRWNDEEFLLSATIAVAGLTAVLAWNAFLPEKKDCLVLGSLPISLPTMAAAKTAATLTALAVGVTAINAFTGLGFPIAIAGRGRFLPIAALGWWVATAAAALFVFCAVMALQGIVSLLLPWQAYLRISGLLQLMALAVVLAWFFGSPPFALTVLNGSPKSAFLPSYWFTGLLNVLMGRGTPALDRLAAIAARNVVIAGTVAIVTTALAWRRNPRRIMETPEITPSKRRFALPAIARVCCPGAFERVIFLFTARTVARSRQHRLLLAVYGGAGLAVAITFLTSFFEGRDRARWNLPNIPFLAVGWLLLFAAIAGMRAIFVLPRDTAANWVFRVTQVRGARLYCAAVRKSLMLMGAAPLWIAAACFYLSVWPGSAGAGAVLLLAPAGLIVVYGSMKEFQKVPFTCAWMPEGAQSRMKMAVWALVLTVFAGTVSGIELWGLSRLARFVVLALILVAVAVRERARCIESAEGSLDFDGGAGNALQTLDLDGDRKPPPEDAPLAPRHYLRSWHFAVLLLVAGLVYEQAGRARESAEYPPIGHAYDIGGRSLNLACAGEGSPAVIFEADWGQAGYVWSHIQRDPQSAGKGFGAAGSAAIQAIKGETNGCLQRNSEVWVRNP